MPLNIDPPYGMTHNKRGYCLTYRDRELNTPGPFEDELECCRIVNELNRAYESGTADQRDLIREALGIQLTPWGVRVEGKERK